MKLPVTKLLSDSLNGFNWDFFSDTLNTNKVISLEKLTTMMSTPQYDLQHTLYTQYKSVEGNKISQIEKEREELENKIEDLNYEIKTTNKRINEQDPRNWSQERINQNRTFYNNKVNQYNKMIDDNLNVAAENTINVKKHNDMIIQIKTLKTNYDIKCNELLLKSKSVIDDDICSVVFKLDQKVKTFDINSYIEYIQIVLVIRNFSIICTNTTMNVQTKNSLNNLFNSTTIIKAVESLSNKITALSKEKINVFAKNNIILQLIKKWNEDYDIVRISETNREIKELVVINFRTEFNYKDVISPSVIDKFKNVISAEVANIKICINLTDDIVSKNKDFVRKINSINKKINEALNEMKGNINNIDTSVENFIDFLCNYECSKLLKSEEKETLKTLITEDLSDKIDEVRFVKEGFIERGNKVTKENKFSYKLISYIVKINEYFISDVHSNTSINMGLELENAYNSLLKFKNKLNVDENTLENSLKGTNLVIEEQSKKYLLDIKSQSKTLYIPLLSILSINGMKLIVKKYKEGVASGNEYFKNPHNELKLAINKFLKINLGYTIGILILSVVFIIFFRKPLVSVLFIIQGISTILLYNMNRDFNKEKTEFNTNINLNDEV